MCHLSNFIMLVWILTGLVLFFLTTLFYKKCAIVYHSLKIPGPAAIPLIASFYLFSVPKKGFINVLLQKCKLYYPVWKTWIGAELYIWTNRPQDVETVLTTFLEKGGIYKQINDAAKDSILTAKVPFWKVNRKLINPTFNLQVLNSFHDMHVKYSTHLVHFLEDTAGAVQGDLITQAWKINLDNLIATLADTEPTLLPNRYDYISASRAFGEICLQRTFKLWLFINLFWKSSSLFKKSTFYCAQARVLPSDLLKLVERAHEAKQYENKCIKQKCFLPHLVKLNYESGAISRNQIVDETLIMFTAGSESSAVTVISALMFLGIYSNIQDKVYEEIISVLGSNDKDPPLEDVNRLEIVERVLKETMRLVPALPVILRRIDQDIKSDSYTYPAGSNIVVPIIYLHYDANVWPNPTKFDPDRFLPEEVEKRHRCSYIPFSIGARNCIGFKYAMMSMKVYLAMIVKKMKVKTVEPKSVDELQWEHFIVLRPKNIRLVFEKRE